MKTLANKVIVITGASSGIGEAMAKVYAAQGAKVVLGARNVQKLQFLAGDIRARGGQAAYCGVDVTKPRWSMELGLNWAKQSRLKRIDGKEPDYMGEDKEFLILYTKEYLKSHPNINYFIYGHRHIELDLMLSATARITILGDWINYFSYAVFDGENLFLENFIEGETKL